MNSYRLLFTLVLAKQVPSLFVPYIQWVNDLLRVYVVIMTLLVGGHNDSIVLFYLIRWP
ncbi:hypothetical protein [Colwellia demingiae]|uniref:hypothetical protein n=1 Tax=Colwellia demingiae TaxID=89401 RepID=UPI001478740C|nr:hypothetical protein [Colwellia demingiae]